MPKEDTQFKKGQSGNPKGKPPLPPEIKELRIRTRAEVEKVMLRLYNLTEGELEKIIKDSKTIFWERHVARIILKGVAKGDHISLGFLSDYIFGAQPKEYRVNATVAAKVAQVSKEELDAAYKRAQEKV